MYVQKYLEYSIYQQLYETYVSSNQSSGVAKYRLKNVNKVFAGKSSMVAPGGSGCTP